MNFKHGGNVYEFAERNGIKVNEVIDFSSNVNFVKPSSVKSFDESLLYSYPDIRYTDLTNVIRNKLNLKANTDFELFNGSSSGIFSLFRYIQPTKCILYAPIYLEYKRITTLYASNTFLINRFTDIEAEVEADSFVIFVNPSTPDGTLYKLDKYIEHWSSKNCTILIDESFMDFTEQESLIPLVEKYKNLYILKSFTKTYGSAGIRIGAVIGNQNNISGLRQFEPPWKISTFDSYYLIEAMKDPLFYEEFKKQHNDNKTLLGNFLKHSRLVEKLYNSSVNFFLVKLRHHTAEEMQKLLTPYNILIRNCYNFDYLDNSHIRLSVKDKQSINKLISSLEEIERSM